MGLTIHYDLRASVGESEVTVRDRLSALRTHALALPCRAVSPMVFLRERELSLPSPMLGLAFPHLENVVDVAARSVRNGMYRRHIGREADDWAPSDVPDDFAVLAMGFAVAPGPGSEPAAFGVATRMPVGTTDWSWGWFCKTQYASNYGEDNFLACHTSLIELLDAAKRIGFDVDVRDDTGYWESRNAERLLTRVRDMNRIVARFAGAFLDQAREAGLDSRRIQGGIFDNPDFERLEGGGPNDE